jgi:hypothetical protein
MLSKRREDDDMRSYEEYLRRYFPQSPPPAVAHGVSAQAFGEAMARQSLRRLAEVLARREAG